MKLLTAARNALAGLVGVAFTGAAIAATMPPLLPKNPSLWEVVFLGIPLGVLCASLGGAAARTFRDEAAPDWGIPRKVRRIVIDGFIGGWVAMFLVTSPRTRQWFDGMSPALLGAFGGLLVQFLFDNAPRWADQAWQTVLSIFSRKKTGSENP